MFLEKEWRKSRYGEPMYVRIGREKIEGAAMGGGISKNNTINALEEDEEESDRRAREERIWWQRLKGCPLQDGTTVQRG